MDTENDATQSAIDEIQEGITRDLGQILGNLTSQNRAKLQEKYEKNLEKIADRSSEAIFPTEDSETSDYVATYNDDDLDIQNTFRKIHRPFTPDVDEFVNSNAPAGPRVLVPGTGAAAAQWFAATMGKSLPAYKSIQVVTGMQAFPNNETYRMTGLFGSPREYARFYPYDPRAGDHKVEGSFVNGIVDHRNTIQGQWLNDVFGLQDWDTEQDYHEIPPEPRILRDHILFEYSDDELQGYGKFQQYAFIPLSLARGNNHEIGQPNFNHRGKTSDWTSISYTPQSYTFDGAHKDYYGMHVDALSWIDWMNMHDHDFRPWDKKKTFKEVLEMSGDGILDRARREILNYPGGDMNADPVSTGVYTHACDHPSFFAHLKTEDDTKDWVRDHYLAIDGFNSPQAYGCRGQAGNAGPAENYPVNMKRSAAAWEAIYGGAGARKGDVTEDHYFAGGKQGRVFTTKQKKFNYVLVEYVLCEAMQEQLSLTGSRFDGFGAIYEKCPLVERDGKIYIQTKNAVWWKQLFPWWFSSGEMPGDVFPGCHNMPPDNNFFSWVNIWGGGEMESCESCGKGAKKIAESLQDAMAHANQQYADNTQSPQEFSSDSSEMSNPPKVLEHGSGSELETNVSNFAFVGLQTTGFETFSSSFESQHIDGNYVHTFNTDEPTMFDNQKLMLGYYWLNSSDRDDHAYTEYEIQSDTIYNDQVLTAEELDKMLDRTKPNLVRLSEDGTSLSIPSLQRGWTRFYLLIDETKLVEQLNFKLDAEFAFDVQYEVFLSSIKVMSGNSTDSTELDLTMDAQHFSSVFSVAVEIYSTEEYTSPLNVMCELTESEDDSASSDEFDFKYVFDDVGGVKIHGPKGTVSSGADVDFLHGNILFDYSALESGEVLLNLPIEDGSSIPQPDEYSDINFAYEEGEFVTVSSASDDNKLVVDKSFWGVDLDTENITYIVKIGDNEVNGKLVYDDTEILTNAWIAEYRSGLNTTHTFSTSFPVNPTIPALNFQQRTYAKVGRETPLQSFSTLTSNYIDTSDIPDSDASSVSDDDQTLDTQNSSSTAPKPLEADDSSEIVGGDGTIDTQLYFDKMATSNEARLAAILMEQFTNLITMQHTINEGAWLSSTDWLFHLLDFYGGALDTKFVALGALAKTSAVAGRTIPLMSKVGRVSSTLNHMLDFGGVGKLTSKTSKMSAHVLGSGVGFLGSRVRVLRQFSDWLISTGAVTDDALRCKYALKVSESGQILHIPGFLEGLWDHLGLHKMPWGRSKIRSLEKMLADNPHPNKFYRMLLEETDDLNQLKKNLSAGSWSPTASLISAVDNFFEELFANMGARILAEADPTDILKTFDEGNFWHFIVDKDTYKTWQIGVKKKGKPMAKDALTFASKKYPDKFAVALSTKHKGKDILLPMEIIPEVHRETVKKWLRTNPQRVTPDMQKFIDEHMEIWTFMHKLHLIEKYTELDYEKLIKIIAVADRIADDVEMTRRGVHLVEGGGRRVLERTILRVIDFSAENYKGHKQSIWNMGVEDSANLVSAFQRNFEKTVKYSTKNNKFLDNLNDMEDFYRRGKSELQQLHTELTECLGFNPDNHSSHSFFKRRLADKPSAAPSDGSPVAFDLNDLRRAYLLQIETRERVYLNSLDIPGQQQPYTWFVGGVKSDIRSALSQVDDAIEATERNIQKAKTFRDKIKSGDDIGVEVLASLRASFPEEGRNFLPGPIQRVFGLTVPEITEPSLGMQLYTKMKYLDGVLVGPGEEITPAHVFYTMHEPAKVKQSLLAAGKIQPDELAQPTDPIYWDTLMNEIRETYRLLHKLSSSADTSLDNLAGSGTQVARGDLRRMIAAGVSQNMDDIFKTKVTRHIDSELFTPGTGAGAAADAKVAVRAHVDELVEDGYITGSYPTNTDGTNLIVRHKVVQSRKVFVIDENGDKVRQVQLKKKVVGGDQDPSNVETMWVDERKAREFTKGKHSVWKFVKEGGKKKFRFQMEKQIRRGCAINVKDAVNKGGSPTLLDDYITHVQALLDGLPGSSPFQVNVTPDPTKWVGGYPPPIKYSYTPDGIPVWNETGNILNQTLESFADDWVDMQAYEMVKEYRTAIIDKVKGSGGRFLDTEVELVGRADGPHPTKEIADQGYDFRLIDDDIDWMDVIGITAEDAALLPLPELIKLRESAVPPERWIYYRTKPVIRHLDDLSDQSATPIAFGRDITYGDELIHDICFDYGGTQERRSFRGVAYDLREQNLEPLKDTAGHQLADGRPFQTNYENDHARVIIADWLRSAAGLNAHKGHVISPPYGTIHNLQLHLRDTVGKAKVTKVSPSVLNPAGEPEAWRYTRAQLQDLYDELIKLRDEAAATSELGVPVTAEISSPRGLGATFMDNLFKSSIQSPSTSGLRNPLGVEEQYMAMWETIRQIGRYIDEGDNAKVSVEELATKVHMGRANATVYRNADGMDLGTILGQVDIHRAYGNMENIQAGQLVALKEVLQTITENMGGLGEHNFKLRYRFWEIIDQFIEAGIDVPYNLTPPTGKPGWSVSSNWLWAKLTVAKVFIDDIIENHTIVNGRMFYQGKPIPLGGTSWDGETKLVALHVSHLPIPVPKMQSVLRVKNVPSGLMETREVYHDAIGWVDYMKYNNAVNRAVANPTDSFGGLSVGEQILDLPTVATGLKQTPELLSAWLRSGRNWEELQKVLTFKHPTTGEIVTLDMLPGAATMEQISIKIPLELQNGVKYGQELIIHPPRTVASAPNGGVGNVNNTASGVVVKETPDFEKSAIGALAKTTNQTEAQLKLEFAKIFGRSKFIEAMLKNLPGGAGPLSNSVTNSLYFLANSGFYAKMLKQPLQANPTKNIGIPEFGEESPWKWDTPLKGGSGVLFSPLSTWFNGYHYVAKELTKQRNATGSSNAPMSESPLSQDSSGATLGAEWNDVISKTISGGENLFHEGEEFLGIPQDQMCSMFHWEDAKRTAVLTAPIVHMMGQVGWAVGMPVDEYLKYRAETQTDNYDPGKPSYFFSDSYQDDVNEAMKQDILTLENNPEATVDLPISYAIRTGEMGVPLHGTLVGSNALMDNIHDMTHMGICWSNEKQHIRGWGYYEKNDGVLGDYDIELHSQDACYACWPEHFPEAFCKGTVNDDGNWPCENNLEADETFSFYDTATRYPGFKTKTVKEYLGFLHGPLTSTKEIFLGLEPMEGSDFTPVFR